MSSLEADSERGVVGGVEVLPFGLLIFVALALVIANAWAVVDAKMAAEDAAREAGRAFVEAHDPSAAPGAARAAGRAAVAGVGRDPSRLDISISAAAYERCEVVQVATGYRMAALTVPFVGRLGSGLVVHGHHREVIDPFASGLGPRNRCGF